MCRAFPHRGIYNGKIGTDLSCTLVVPSLHVSIAMGNCRMVGRLQRMGFSSCADTMQWVSLARSTAGLSLSSTLILSHLLSSPSSRLNSQGHFRASNPSTLLLGDSTGRAGQEEQCQKWLGGGLCALRCIYS